MLADPNRWQPLTLEVYVDQAGNEFPGATPPFISPEWGEVTPFALSEADLTIRERDGYRYRVYHDPGAPPYLDPSDRSGRSAAYQWGILAGIDLVFPPRSGGRRAVGHFTGVGRQPPATAAQRRGLSGLLRFCLKGATPVTDTR